MNKYTGNLSYPINLLFSSLSLILPMNPLKSTLDNREKTHNASPRPKIGRNIYFSEARREMPMVFLRVATKWRAVGKFVAEEMRTRCVKADR